MGFEDLLMGALTALLATSLGALIVLAFKNIGRRAYSIMLAFCAGVMAFSAIEMLGEAHSSIGDAAVVGGVVLGLLALFAADRLLPHAHAKLRGREITASKKKAALLAGAVTIHNVPEGFAIASAFAGGTPLGWMVTAAIALQDIPEGLMISAPLACYGVEKRRAICFGLLSGVVEATAAVAFYLFLNSFVSLVPFALAFSAGAMLYVIFAELLPDSFSEGMQGVAALSFAAGAAVAFGIAGLVAP